jgi:hypothetical protein
LVAIDDAQWLDRSSLAVLEFAWRRLVAEPVALLIASRGEDKERVLDLGAVAAVGRLREVAVGPLSAGALQRLLRTRVGVTLARPTLLRVLDACGGNPFYALEIGRVLAASGPLAPAAPLPIPPTLAGVMVARIAALPKPVQAILLPVAAMADPTASLLEALRGNSSLTRRHLQRAAAAGVLEINDERVRFSHPLLAAGLYASRQQRSAERFPCNSVGFSASGTFTSKDPEPPRKASNLSPKPSPNETVLVAAICRN